MGWPPPSPRVPLDLTGATAATRYVGGTASGAPLVGTFAVGDFVIDETGFVWICTVAGSPGTWVSGQASGGVTNAAATAISSGTGGVSGDTTIATNGVVRFRVGFNGAVSVTPAANVVAFTVTGAVGATADLVEAKNSGGTILFSVQPNGHGVTLNRPAGVAPDYALGLYFTLAGANKWSLGLSIEQVLFYINEGGSGNDVFTINANRVVGVGDGTVTSTTENTARMYVNADGKTTTLRLTHETFDSSHYWTRLFGTVAGVLETQPRIAFATDTSIRFGPGGSTSPDYTISYVAAGGPGPGIAFQPSVDSTRAFKVFNAAGSSKLFVDTTNGMVGASSLGLGNSATATGPVGTIVKKIQIFDTSHTSLGYLPVYDAIT